MKEISAFSVEECEKWNNEYEKATHDNDKKKIMSLLSESNKLFLDEYFIYSTICEMNDDSTIDASKVTLVDKLNKSKIVKFVMERNGYTEINTRATCIKVAKLSNIFNDVIHDTGSKESVIRKDKFSAEYLSQLISFPNSIVTGYVYGISDKSKKIHTWLEFKNNFNQPFVVDYADNTVYNKEGYYFLKHVEPIKKVSSDDLRGKSSKGKSSSSEISDQIVDIEIDMGDER